MPDDNRYGIYKKFRGFVVHTTYPQTFRMIAKLYQVRIIKETPIEQPKDKEPETQFVYSLPGFLRNPKEKNEHMSKFFNSFLDQVQRQEYKDKQQLELFTLTSYKND